MNKKINLYISLGIIIVSILLLATQLVIFETKVYVVDGETRMAAPIQFSSNNRNILLDQEPVAYYSSIISIIFLSVVPVLLLCILVRKSLKNLEITVELQFQIIFVMIIAFSLFLLIYSSYWHFNFPIQEWLNSQNHA